jgi:diguanylate cyclase (GGDEF)-like protein/PAS domain S-box-containing protein
MVYEIVIPSLYWLTGILSFATVHHLLAALNPPRDRVQLLFSGITFLSVFFALSFVSTLQAVDIVEYIHALRWNIAVIFLLMLLFPWFIALLTGIAPRSLLVGLSVLQAVSFVANLAQPYTLQYDRLDGLHTLHLPWGEQVTRGDGHPSFLTYTTIAVMALDFGFAFYALTIAYRRDRKLTDLWMLIATGVYLLCAIEGILARLSVVNFIETGPIGILAMVAVMSAALTIEMQKRVRTSERHFRSIFENSPTGLVAIDPESRRIVQANRIALEMNGFNPEEILTKTVAELTYPDDLNQSEYRQNYEQLSSGFVDHLSYEKRYLRKDGSSFFGLTSISTLKDENGKIMRFIGSTIDISDRKKMEDALHESELRFRTIIEQSPIGIAFGRDGIMLDANEVLLQMYAYKDIAEVRGQPIINRIAPQCRAEVNERIRKRFLGEPTEGTYETIGLRTDGSQFPLLVSVKRVVLSDGPLTCAFEIDITDRKAAEEKINHLAFYDHLTDLPNRLLLLDRLHQAMASSGRSGKQGALLFIDLDDFKSLNDTLGHAAGDLLLKQVAQRLTSSVREGDSVARFGSDEFVVLLQDLSGQLIEAAEQTEVSCNKIFDALTLPYQLGAHEYQCTISIGATLFKDHQQTKEDLIKQADIAMSHAKKSGRSNLRFFDPKMQAAIDTHAALEGELRHALKKEQFQLHYQIQIDNSGRPIGAEALIRWVHPERGLISPAQFIPLAEETDLILPMGQWVIETACAQLKAWKSDEMTRNLVLAVNISAKQFFQANFVTHILAAVHYHNINPNLLKLELTESILVDDIEDTILTMNTLKEIGVRFSLDDFGTGYSSLQYLKRLPLDQLKIDQSFVRDLGTDSNDEALVRTIIAMAQSLNLDVIAEGVETESQREFLLRNGCTRYQGFLFGKPLPVEQFEVLLK